jgi:hypothetical protein
MCGGGIDIGKRDVMADETPDEVGALAAEFGPDIIQHDRAEQRWTRGDEAHAEQSAKAGADGGRLVQMQCSADVEHIAHAGLRRITRDVARPARLATTGIVGSHDASARADRMRKRLEVAGSPHDARHAEPRCVCIAAPPFADAKR